jgi:type III restriction enzyme
LRVLLPHDPDSYFRHRDLAATDMLGDFERARIIITKKSRLPLAQ